MRLLLASSIFRSAPVLASAVVHVGIAAAGLAVGAGGHGRAPLSVASPSDTTIDIQAPAEPAPEPAPAPEREEIPEPKPTPVAAPPTHTHDYPVPPSHDMHPHDPSIVHDHDAPAAPAADPAAAAPAVTSDAALPRFDLSVGKGVPSGAHVVVVADGTGAGTRGVVASPAPPSDPVVPESAVSVPASLVSRAAAAYPAAARAGELEADVPLEIVVDTTGAVVDARLLARAGSGFDESALSAIRRYRFSPAQRDGHAVRVRMRWAVQFRLR